MEEKIKGCTLSNDELIAAAKEWIHDLAESGGKKWMLRIPVDFNRDPDMIFLELCKRLESHNANKVYNQALVDYRNVMMDFLENNPPNRAHTMIALDDYLDKLTKESTETDKPEKTPSQTVSKRL